MKTNRRDWDIDRIIRHGIGWTALLAGVTYLFFGNYHCDMARFLACAVCVGVWTIATIDDKEK